MLIKNISFLICVMCIYFLPFMICTHKVENLLTEGCVTLPLLGVGGGEVEGGGETLDEAARGPRQG